MKAINTMSRYDHVQWRHTNYCGGLGFFKLCKCTDMNSTTLSINVQISITMHTVIQCCFAVTVARYEVWYINYSACNYAGRVIHAVMRETVHMASCYNNVTATCQYFEMVISQSLKRCRQCTIKKWNWYM